LAWRIWQPNGETVSADLGQVHLLESAALSPRQLDEIQSFSGDLRGMVRKGPSEQLLACVVDGSSLLGEVRRYITIGVLLVLATIAMMFCMGHMLVGKITRTMRQVAESARRVNAAGEPLRVDLKDAPVEIRELVAALQEMRANVQTESERNQVFTASMAHELRSPIQNLMGETEVALMTPRDGPEYRRVLISHLQELRDLADAVDNLVTICSQRKGDTNLIQTRESFDLAPEAALRLAREQGYASSRGVQLNLDSRGDTRLYGDREGLLRAMRNLTANAIEWSAAGSQVDVTVAGENGRVVVTVDDAGPGVPEELRDKIFAPFFRGPQAQGRRIGYGLGLAIVRSAVASQGGRIEVGRSPKGGARFCLLLPRNLHLPPTEETPTPF
jgi:two-component system heavy metal sensor histidine kinase CusS